MLKKIALATVALVAGAVAAAAGEVRVMSFGGATNLPIWVAQDKGFFEKEGVKLTFKTTTGSIEQIREFYAGHFDVISTAFDNIVAYAEGQSDVALPGPADMFAFVGIHGGMNTLMVRPEINSYADIKGKVVAVDALKSGYGIVLYQILQKKGGLTFDKDYTAISVGNTDKRLAAMRDKKAVAAIIGAPTDMEAQKDGFKPLADAAVELGAYQGSALVARRSWAKDHDADMLAFVRAAAAAQDYIFANKAESVAILLKNVRGLKQDEAEKLYDRLVAPGGLSPHGKIDPKAIQTVLEIRETYGEPRKKMGPISKYVDFSYYERAMAKK
jgi:ABC-type nitrate/sulfonate/bicarbonate transport system substrate-binding protein